MKNLRLELQHRSCMKASSVGEAGPPQYLDEVRPRTRIDGQPFDFALSGIGSVRTGVQRTRPEERAPGRFAALLLVPPGAARLCLPSFPVRCSSKHPRPGADISRSNQESTGP